MAQAGLHHVTALASLAARNRAFYTDVLGLRLVKRTVNFDDPSTYHLYFGDEAGRPGTILTFFPIPNAAPGCHGAGETAETALRVPATSLRYWADRLTHKNVRVEVSEVFGDPVLRFVDPDGARLTLVGADGDAGIPWSGSTVAAEHAVVGLHGVTLLVADPEPTGAVLRDVLGFSERARDSESVRFTSGASVGGTVTLRRSETTIRGRQGTGSVHHVAFRAADDAAQATMAAQLRDAFGLCPTEQKDRSYFRSIYFREPGGVLFEIATDAPGFAVDEAPDRLGQSLMLPAGLERLRERIEEALPSLEAA